MTTHNVVFFEIAEIGCVPTRTFGGTWRVKHKALGTGRSWWFSCTNAWCLLHYYVYGTLIRNLAAQRTPCIYDLASSRFGNLQCVSE
jgi:hypothetical protein